MMKRPSLLRSVFLLSCAILIGACAKSVTPIGEWRDSAYTDKIDKLLIVGATSRSTQRRVFEDLFVQAMVATEVSTTPSYKLITNSLELSRETVTQAIQGHNIDAVLVTRLAGVREEEHYKLPTDHDYYNHYEEYYDHAVEKSTRGYFSQFNVLTLETNVYDATSGKLVWSMQSDTIDRSAPRHLIVDQIDLTIQMMTKQGLI